VLAPGHPAKALEIAAVSRPGRTRKFRKTAS